MITLLNEADLPPGRIVFRHDKAITAGFMQNRQYFVLEPA